MFRPPKRNPHKVREMTAAEWEAKLNEADELSDEQAWYVEEDGPQTFDPEDYIGTQGLHNRKVKAQLSRLEKMAAEGRLDEVELGEYENHYELYWGLYRTMYGAELGGCMPNDPPCMKCPTCRFTLLVEDPAMPRAPKHSSERKSSELWRAAGTYRWSGDTNGERVADPTASNVPSGDATSHIVREEDAGLTAQQLRSAKRQKRQQWGRKRTKRAKR